MKQNKVNFKNQKIGPGIFKPLKKTIKNNLGKEVERDLTDIEYFELLGRYCVELEKNQGEIITYPDGLDKEVCIFAKDIVSKIDSGENTEKITNYIKNSIEV